MSALGVQRLSGFSWKLLPGGQPKPAPRRPHYWPRSVSGSWDPLIGVMPIGYCEAVPERGKVWKLLPAQKQEGIVHTGFCGASGTNGPCTRTSGSLYSNFCMALSVVESKGRGTSDSGVSHWLTELRPQLLEVFSSSRAVDLLYWVELFPCTCKAQPGKGSAAHP